MDFWELTVRFFSLADANVRQVIAGSILLGGAAGALGCFAYLQRRSLLGDALAHAALPGVGLAFLIVGQKEFVPLLLGATATAWLGALSINAIDRYTKIKLDAALGIVLTVFFGLGIVILTHIQKSGSGSQAGLGSFIFGQAAAMSRQDVVALAVVTVCMLSVVTIGYRHFKLVSFDTGFAFAVGLPVGRLQFILTTMIVLAVTVGLQAVGVVLMAAMLITPAAAARQWTDRLPRMLMLASIFGMLAGLFGSYISFLKPSLPTGPWIVIVVSGIFAVSILFSPRRGVLIRILRHYQHRGKITRDHLVKSLYRVGMERENWYAYYPVSEIAHMWSFTPTELRSGLSQLTAQGFLEREVDMYRLTQNGVSAGARVTRLHRLWEVYLTRYLELPGDHVHRDAEDMEHIITPEMEEQLSQMLDHPVFDPHLQPIPYPTEQKGV
ncbi:MAG: metal ABC transporter permease [candidate division Zixibacteria bacterium]|nr:metal ABC transporter permease [candidate division Zixibacteria bacterium]